jgi:Lecithin:cholesterol acyltransferase
MSPGPVFVTGARVVVKHWGWLSRRLRYGWRSGCGGAEVAALRHLVVFLPGIAGSALRSADGRQRWGVLSAPWAWLDPSRLCLDTHPMLHPDGLVPDLVVVRGLPVVPNYGWLLRQLENMFGATVDVARWKVPPNLRADVLVVPYDFRRSVADAACWLDRVVRERLDGEVASAQRQRVIVVAHSMGGLVARYWLGPGNGWPLCRALVTLGTPHRGAPKALQWLVNGSPVIHEELLRVLRGWPSMYELLPRYEAVWDAQARRKRYPHQVRPHWLAKYADTFATRAGQAYAVHQDIDCGWAEIPDGRVPTVVLRYARGHATLGAAVLDKDRLVVRKQEPGWLGTSPRPGGDSTVPGLSAVPWQYDERPELRLAVAERHGPMAHAPHVLGILAEYSQDSATHVRGSDEPERPWVGVDLEDQYPVGSCIPVSATVHGASADKRTAVSVMVRTPSGGSVVRPRMPLTRIGDRDWAGELDALPVGCYQVTVEASAVPGHDELVCADHIGVVDEREELQ